MPLRDPMNETFLPVWMEAKLGMVSSESFRPVPWRPARGTGGAGSLVSLAAGCVGAGCLGVRLRAGSGSLRCSHGRLLRLGRLRRFGGLGRLYRLCRFGSLARFHGLHRWRRTSQAPQAAWSEGLEFVQRGLPALVAPQRAREFSLSLPPRERPPAPR